MAWWKFPEMAEEPEICRIVRIASLPPVGITNYGDMTSPSSAFLRGVLFWIAVCGCLAAQERVRLVTLRLPTTDVGAVAVQLEGAKEEAMVPVLKKKGITAWADFAKDRPWSGGKMDFKKETGSIRFGGESAHDHGIEIEVEPTDAGDEMHSRIAATVSLPIGEKGYRSMQYLVAEVMPKKQSGTWREMARWNDGKEAVMLWMFSVTGEPGTADASKREMKNVKMEVLFFKAEEADIKKLGLATVETKDNAFRWISQKATLVHEAAFVARSRDKMIWSDGKGTMEEKGGVVSADESHVALETEFSGEVSALKVQCRLITSKSGSGDENPKNLPVPSVFGVWEFSPVEGMEGSNLMAMRLSWP